MVCLRVFGGVVLRRARPATHKPRRRSRAPHGPRASRRLPPLLSDLDGPGAYHQLGQGGRVFIRTFRRCACNVIQYFNRCLNMISWYPLIKISEILRLYQAKCCSEISYDIFMNSLYPKFDSKIKICYHLR